MNFLSRRGRGSLSFRAVNKRDSADYRPDMQRHHLLPRGLLGLGTLSRFFRTIRPQSVGYEDFRRNGMLLPSEEQAARRTGLPLHRGPHPSYDEMVTERVGEIESEWAASRLKRPKLSAIKARLRLSLLQRSLRRELLSPNPPPLAMPRDEEIGRQMDFAELDRMAADLWSATEPRQSVSNLPSKASRAD